MPPRKRRRDLARDLGTFDPLALPSLQGALRERLERTEPDVFPPSDFLGAGVYALYYVGSFDLYRPLVETDCRVPIYVGKAEAGNSSYGQPADANGLQLIDRIKKHAKSVSESTETLRLEDFRIRYLPIDDAWIVLAERALLRDYRPVLWNTIMPGFGANEPGSDRQNARSVWDTVHPGRTRGRLCNRRFTLDEMRERIALAVKASVLEEGPARTLALRDSSTYAQPPIWRPKKRNETGPRVVVQDEGRFLAEMMRLGLETPEYRTVSGETEPVDDPEVAAELNVLAAEALEGEDPESSSE